MSAMSLWAVARRGVPQGAASAPSVGAAPATLAISKARPRLAFIDNIRWMVIVMVLAVHASVTYSGLGSWYYTEATTLDMVSSLVFTFYQSFSQAFFMGLLFLVAGAFVPGAYDRKGFGRFVADRLLRLGAPTLTYILVLDPATNLIREIGLGRAGLTAAVFSQYLAHISSLGALGGTGPLWFTLALLAFSVLYAAVRLALDAIRRHRPLAAGSSAARASSPPLSLRAVSVAAIALIALTALGSFLVRLVQPIGESWFNMQFSYFTQYVVLFVVGLWIGRTGFLDTIQTRLGMGWLRLAFIVGVPVWLLLLGFGGALSGSLEAFMGGWHWQAAGLALWEAFVGVAMSLGLLVLFREKANVRSKASGFLADNCFGVYVFHAPILVAASMLLRSLTLYPLAKVLIVTIIALAASLALTALVRKVPGLKKLFS